MNGFLESVDSVAHIIQVALTPVFLFSVVASLLGVLSTRLGRVADRVDLIAERLETAGPSERRRLQVLLSFLRRRSLILDLAVMLGALAGAATCLAALLLFIGSLRERAAIGMFLAFGLALVLTVGALICFLLEMLLASRGIRVQADDASEAAEGEVDQPAPKRDTNRRPML